MLDQVAQENLPLLLFYFDIMTRIKVSLQDEFYKFDDIFQALLIEVKEGNLQQKIFLSAKSFVLGSTLISVCRVWNISCYFLVCATTCELITQNFPSSVYVVNILVHCCLQGAY